MPRVPGPLDELSTTEALRWWQGAGTMPHVRAEPEGQAVYTFCWQDGEAERVLLWANRLTDETDLPATMMTRVVDTDLWHASFRLPTDWRASYCFLADRPGEESSWWGERDQSALRRALDRGEVDPRNPVWSHNRAGVRQSVAEGPDAASQPWRERRADVDRGTVTRHQVAGRDVWLHDPAGHAVTEELALLVVLDGEVWLDQQDLPTTLDNLWSDAAAPVHRTVFVSSGGVDRRWSELGMGDAGVALVVEEVLPWVRTARAVLPGPGAVTVSGQSLGGLAALRCGLLAPGSVGRVASQSASTWQDDLASAIEAYATDPPSEPLRIHLSHGEHEWVLVPGHDGLASRLEAAGVRVERAFHCGGHDYAWWCGALPDALVWLSRSS